MPTFLLNELKDLKYKKLTTGTILLEGLTEVKTEVSGKIADVYVDEDDIFKKDELF
jgi:hypothetical protein